MCEWLLCFLILSASLLVVSLFTILICFIWDKSLPDCLSKIVFTILSISPFLTIVFAVIYCYRFQL